MIEMLHGETAIKVLAHKVDEMIRKGWKFKEEAGLSEPDLIEDEISEEEITDGNS